MFDNSEKTKKIYDYCVDNGWNVTKIRELASSLKMTYEDTLYEALGYAKEKVSEDEYKMICKTVSNNKRGRYDLDIPNPVLSNDGETVYQIWRNSEEKIKVLKYIYDSWKTKDIKNIALEFGIDNDKVIRLVREYAINILKLSSSEWQELRDEVRMIKSRRKKRENLENITGNAKVLSQLINANTLEEVVALVDSVSDLIKLRSSIHDYLVIYHDLKDYDKYHDLLVSKLAFYSAYQKEKQKEKNALDDEKFVAETLPRAVQLITMFVDSDCNSIQEFIDKNRIVGDGILNGNKIFSVCLKLVEKYNSPLYARYIEKVESQRRKNYGIIANQVKTVISLLKNGIIENDVKRPFDIIDYFQLTRVSFSSMKKVAEDMMKKRVIDAKQYSLFARFRRNNLGAEKINYSDIDKILMEKEEVNCAKNDNRIKT